MREWIRSAYRAVLPHLPRRVARIVSQADFILSAEPLVYREPGVHPPDGLRRGAVIISVDFEMAWAWQYSKNPKEDCVSIGLREREQVPLIVEQFDRYEIPATWATVGHLFLDACNRGADQMAHRGMPRLKPFKSANWQFRGGDWFQNDPCTDVKHDPAWYAPDLIELILASPVRHEVGCHSFSHAGFGDYCPPEVARAEIGACREVMAKYGLQPTTWVFPGNEEGNFDALSDGGVRIVRAYPHRSAQISLPLRRVDGLWAVHTSSGIDRGRYWTYGQRLTWLKKLVRAAIKTKLAACVWLHPSLPLSEMTDLLAPFLRYCAQERDKGLVDIFTMRQLVETTEAAQANLASIDPKSTKR